ncbi:Crp/Fnr family transcriptional regulator [Sphingomonas sp.]|uniref:Crp/Fnr family transcriptional regulator n=1 Tax=Sphingomonas sp. TaxID=28214 RepID=UPI003B003A93
MLMRTGEPFPLANSRNRLLRSLRPADRAMLAPDLEQVPLQRGSRLFTADALVDRLYFPERGLLALGEGRGLTARVEIAVVGCEGLVGWPALLGCELCAHDAVVQGSDGRALSIAVEPLLAACRASQTLWMALLGFVQAVMNQMTRTIASSIENTLDQRIARWLLIRHDRLDGDHLLIRHDEIASALGVRRASVTDRLHVIEGERLVRCRRGRIVIRDRAALETFAGEAYGACEAEYRGLLPTSDAASH